MIRFEPEQHQTLNSGSRWYRWEPHVHAPGTVLNDQFKGANSWEGYLKAVESRLPVVEKLLGAKSLETVIQIQSEYAKTSYAAFVAQTAKMGELHSNLAKAAFKPAELAIANMQGTK